MSRTLLSAGYSVIIRGSEEDGYEWEHARAKELRVRLEALEKEFEDISLAFF